MKATELIEEIDLIVGAGDAEDALNLSRRLIRMNQVKWAVDVRRTVSGGLLSQDALRELAVQIAEYAAEQDMRMHSEWESLNRESAALARITRSTMRRLAARVIGA
ncbi:hypothetical protein ACFRFL_14105 [Streptomyces sp. NPDC056708]|uniref:hypothetical protein n=1 Tax=unclassified Streptomyces TaxID=2593676 RepID=UPI0036BDA87C